MSIDSGSGESGSALLAEGERELARGESERAFALLHRAASLGVPNEALERLATSYARAARFVSRHRDVLDWVERALHGATSRDERALLQHARISVCRQVDVARVIELAEDALSAASAAGDDEAYASVVSHAAFAAYRTGDARAAAAFSGRLANRAPRSRRIELHHHRAAMFAASARGDMERALALSILSFDIALELDFPADAANEANNLAETLLELGLPAEALRYAERGVELARRAGHRQVEQYGEVMAAAAVAESGDLDAALARLAAIDTLWCNGILAIDAAATEAFWLLERGAAGDASRARDVAERALELAADSGVENQRTVLWSQIARCWSRESQPQTAAEALERARRVLDRAEPRCEQHLALAFAEVLAQDEPRRRTALTNARSRILRRATSRAQPRAFCAHVRLHRRLLELSGGVPGDLP